MRIVFFVHSIVSDWNNGHAHFLRGLGAALIARGHKVRFCEPRENWSTDNLFKTAKAQPIMDFARRFPWVRVQFYDPKEDVVEQVDEMTAGADVVVVHEFNEPEIVGAVGYIRRRREDFLLLFHDTHHRLISLPHEILRFNLADYDGILAFGRSLAEAYRDKLPGKPVHVFHEAADMKTFRPLEREKEHDVVWVGNWGDDERAGPIRDYLIGSASTLADLRFTVYGVRYPKHALSVFKRARIQYEGWVPNYQVPEVFARSHVTLHILRSFYTQALPGIPTIRPFEAMACGIPLITTQWRDTEGLFTVGKDYLMAESPEQMHQSIRLLVENEDIRQDLAGHALETIRRRHHCGLRAEQFETLCESMVMHAG